MVVGNAGRVLKIEGVTGNVRLDTGVKHNLRSVSVSSATNTTLVVGNSGTVITIKPDGSSAKVTTPTFENLRTVQWNTDGTAALIAGNNGTLMKYTQEKLDAVNDGRANLRGIAWRKDTDDALITSNCFAEEFIPSPNLFLFKARTNELNAISEGRSDLIGVDWSPDGNLAVVVGYDVVWHTGFIGRFDASGLAAIEFENSRVYPIATAWDPTGRMAAIATSVTQLRSGQGKILLWDRETFKEIYSNSEFFFSDLAWAPGGFKLAAIASTEARTFDT
jgi:WD40 repeat protein